MAQPPGNRPAGRPAAAGRAGGAAPGTRAVRRRGTNTALFFDPLYVFAITQLAPAARAAELARRRADRDPAPPALPEAFGRRGLVSVPRIAAVALLAVLVPAGTVVTPLALLTAATLTVAAVAGSYVIMLRAARAGPG